MNIVTIFALYTINYLRTRLALTMSGRSNVDNISKLFNSCINVSVSIVCCIFYLVTYNIDYVNLLHDMSIGFYLYDLILVIKRRQYIFIIHHLITIYSMDKWLPININDIEGNMLVVKYLVLETGNFSIYRVSYKKHTNIDVTLNDLLLELCNMVMRIIFAMYCFTITQDIEKLCVVSMMLSGAIFWSSKLIPQVLKKIK